MGGVFVDDGSRDGTHAALVRLHDRADNVKVVRLRRNAGKAAALDAGFREAEGDVVVTIDGDLQDDPAEIPRLLAKLDEGFDLVTGWKTRRNDPAVRRFLSRVFNTVTGWVSGLRLHDMNCGLKAFRVEVARELDLYGELHRFIPVLAHDLGFRVTEIAGQPPAARARPQPVRDGAVRARLPRPADRHVHGPVPAPAAPPLRRARARCSRLVGGAILVYLTIVKLTGEPIGRRPLLLLGVLLVVVGIQFLSLGLLSELVTSQHRERMRAQTGDRASRLVDEIRR